MFSPDKPAVRHRGRIPLGEIDAAVAARLGPGRVSGNAQPAAFSRQVAMYMAHEIGGWSTTRIGKFYNGRDHSTVCYAVARIRSLRETDPEVDSLLSVLTSELSDGLPTQPSQAPNLPPVSAPRAANPLLSEAILDAIADRVAQRVLAHLSSLGLTAELESRKVDREIP